MLLVSKRMNTSAIAPGPSPARTNAGVDMGTGLKWGTRVTMAVLAASGTETLDAVQCLTTRPLQPLLQKINY